MGKNKSIKDELDRILKNKHQDFHQLLRFMNNREMKTVFGDDFENNIIYKEHGSEEYDILYFQEDKKVYFVRCEPSTDSENNEGYIMRVMFKKDLVLYLEPNGEEVINLLRKKKKMLQSIDVIEKIAENPKYRLKRVIKNM